MIEYIVGGAVLLTCIAYLSSKPNRRRRRQAASAPSRANADRADLSPPVDLNLDSGHQDHDHHHQDHGHHGADYGGDHTGHHGGDFDLGGGGHHH